MTVEPSETESPSRPWPLAAWVAIGLVLGWHAVWAAGLFPSWRTFVDDSPVIVVDHAIHLYHGALGARFLAEHGTTWGQDPFFMAGYPETPVWDSSSNLAILFESLAGFGYSPRAYKIGLYVCSVLTVAFVPLAARVMNLRPAESVLATLLGALGFWLGFTNSLWRSGLFAYLTVSSGVLLLLALMDRVDRRPTWRTWLALAGFGALLFFAHVTAPILALGGGLAFLVLSVRRHDWRWWARLATSTAFVVLVNLIWLVPLWRFRSMRSSVFVFLTDSTGLFLPSLYLSGTPEGVLSAVVLLLGLVGLGFWVAEGRGTLAAIVGASALALLLLTNFGGLWEPTRLLEPLRYRVPALWLLTLPAASAVARSAGWVARRAGGGRVGSALGGSVWVLLLLGLALLVPRAFRDVWIILNENRPLVVGLKPEMRQLLTWLQEQTDPSARVLFEDQLRLLEPTDPESTHWTPLLPILLGKKSPPFIGGIYHTAFILPNKAASFGDFHLAGDLIDTWTPSKLRAYFERYNVGWVVCWSPLSRFWFDRIGVVEKVGTIPRYSTPGRPSLVQSEGEAIARRAGNAVAVEYMSEGDRFYSLYRVDRPHSFFLQGKGRVARWDWNEVELADLEPSDGAVVLSLHAMETWTTDPPCRVSPFPVDGDPVPFVKIEMEGPMHKIVLKNGY